MNVNEPTATDHREEIIVCVEAADDERACSFAVPLVARAWPVGSASLMRVVPLSACVGPALVRMPCSSRRRSPWWNARSGGRSGRSPNTCSAGLPAGRPVDARGGRRVLPQVPGSGARGGELVTKDEIAEIAEQIVRLCDELARLGSGDMDDYHREPWFVPLSEALYAEGPAAGAVGIDVYRGGLDMIEHYDWRAGTGPPRSTARTARSTGPCASARATWSRSLNLSRRGPSWSS